MGKFTILDGGMGRLLKQMGAPFRQPEWSALALMEAPDFVSKAHQAFIGAGAEIITTNSYALVPFHIGQNEFDKNGRALIKRAAEIACESIKENKNVKIAGSLPPAFGSYRPDLFIKDAAEEIYTPLIEEQNDYVDLWLVETVSHTDEIKLVAQLLKGNTKPKWVSYTVLDRNGKNLEPQLRSGETIEQAVQTAINLGFSSVLFNCSQAEEMLPILKIIQNMDVSIPYGVYPNAFEPIKHNQQANDQVALLRQDTTPEYFLELAKDWQEHGATIIGGCCGIGPEHIELLKTLK